eukprot:scaffold227633_cov31-Tisochrysis_lutea.AAC.5
MNAPSDAPNIRLWDTPTHAWGGNLSARARTGTKMPPPPIPPVAASAATTKKSAATAASNQYGMLRGDSAPNPVPGLTL